jgi:polyisoprenoid-binding protein YceI
VVQRVGLIIGGIVVLALAALAVYVFRPPEEASAPIAAIPLDAATAAPTAPPAAAVTEVAATAPAAVTEVPTNAPAAVTDVAATVEPTAASAGSEQVFEILSTESQARFLIDEVLQGSPITVVGTTDQVAGQIAINAADPQSTRLGTIQINARTLATDNDFRNRAIKNAILRTNDFEFVTFTPTGISGLPASVTVGTPFTFQVSGDLTITDVTKPVTFEVTVTPTADNRIEGLATTSVLYRDFNLTIPDSPAVDTIADEVKLELEFVAQAVG